MDTAQTEVSLTAKRELVYTEIKAAKVLSYMQSDDGDSDKGAAAFGVTVRFEEEGHQTRATMHAQFKTAAERDRAVQEVDAISEANQTLARLDKFLKELLPPH